MNNKIELIPLQQCNLEQVRQWRNRQDIKETTKSHHEITPQQQQDWFQSKVQNNPNAYYFEIHTTDSSKQFIGVCALQNINWISRNAEFSIYLGDLNYRGQGLGKEALKSLLTYGFNTLNLHRIWGQVLLTNQLALNFYKNYFNFTVEGILKEDHFNLKTTTYIDVGIIGLLKRNFDTNL